MREEFLSMYHHGMVVPGQQECVGERVSWKKIRIYLFSLGVEGQTMWAAARESKRRFSNEF
jgi:hypothetical protein